MTNLALVVLIVMTGTAYSELLEFKVNDYVMLHSLKTKEFNGWFGQILSGIDQFDRYGMRVFVYAKNTRFQSIRINKGNIHLPIFHQTVRPVPTADLLENFYLAYELKDVAHSSTKEVEKYVATVSKLNASKPEQQLVFFDMAKRFGSANVMKLFSAETYNVNLRFPVGGYLISSDESNLTLSWIAQIIGYGDSLNETCYADGFYVQVLAVDHDSEQAMFMDYGTQSKWWDAIVINDRTWTEMKNAQFQATVNRKELTIFCHEQVDILQKYYDAFNSKSKSEMRFELYRNNGIIRNSLTDFELKARMMYFHFRSLYNYGFASKLYGCMMYHWENTRNMTFQMNAYPLKRKL